MHNAHSRRAAGTPRGSTGRALDLAAYFRRQRARVDRALDRAMPGADVPPESLHEAMRYCVFSGGKRLRPILCLAACEAAGGHPAAALYPAMAIELLHTYTLIHDDLPAMDNDDLRRGRPTCHRAFGEANAILAGDALQAMAFEFLAAPRAIAPPVRLAMVARLAAAAGSRGVIRGQVDDIAAQGRVVSARAMTVIHAHKTALLFETSLVLGALAAGAPPPALRRLAAFGTALGMAFQITDDILDQDRGKHGKKKAELNCVSVHGLGKARRLAGNYVEAALAAVSAFPTARAAPLAAIAQFVLERTE